MKDLLTFINTELNDSQKQAVEHKHGSLLVIAGAGSGKTRIITARIAHLIIQEHVPARAIIALTFTNKAAREMRERIAHFLSKQQQLPFVGTFHAYCIKLLKRYAALANLDTFSVLDEEDQLSIIKAIMVRINVFKQLTPRQVLYQISHAKNQLHNPTVQPVALFTHLIVYDIYKAYEAEKRASKCFDFDDLMLEVLNLFRTNSTFKQAFQSEVHHVLIDEYQDTNIIQRELLCQMTKNDGALVADSVCAVGDEDQSIYSWRGATVANILNFSQDFPETTIIKAEQNYRSVTPILELANSIIANNAHRTPKTLWSERQAANRTKIVACLSEYQEAEIIASCCQEAARRIDRNAIAILYRTHAQSRALEEALIKRNVPYRIIGGVAFYERREIKDLLAYMRLLVNPFDRPSFFRVINTPLRGLGQKFEEDARATWDTNPFCTFKELLPQLNLHGTKLQAANQFLSIIAELDAATEPTKALETIIQRSRYLEYIRDSEEPQEAETRLANIQELIDAARHFNAQGFSSVEAFLHEISLIQDKAHGNEDTKRISLMTLHAAKGLEFDLVIIPGLEESLFPSTRSTYDPESLEEERRLLYVGITRAREYLLITHARYRYIYGSMIEQAQSRFMREMPTSLICHEDASSWSGVSHSAYFEAWLSGHHEATKPQIRIQHSRIEARTQEKAASSTQAIQAATTSSTVRRIFKVNQPVAHETFGMGIIQSIETKSDGSLFLTVKFKTTTKKILSSFVKAL
jgi:DNA helicase-2/ATP-dependent DNA helicase PcrA